MAHRKLIDFYPDMAAATAGMLKAALHDVPDDAVLRHEAFGSLATFRGIYEAEGGEVVFVPTGLGDLFGED